MSAEAPSQSRIARAALGALRLAVASAELWLAHAWFAGDGTRSALLAAHFGIVACFAGVAWYLHSPDDAGLWVDGSLLFLAGPLGAIGMLWRRAAAAPGGLSSAGEPDRRSAAELLHADIAADRRPRRDPENRVSLMDRVTGDDLASQQFAISMLSLAYQPSMYPVLMAALQSSTPAVRVQAAAVFAKLRERFGLQAKHLLALTADGGAAYRREKADACRALARSPFMEQNLADALLEKARGFEAALSLNASTNDAASVRSEIAGGTEAEVATGPLVSGAREPIG